MKREEGGTHCSVADEEASLGGEEEGQRGAGVETEGMRWDGEATDFADCSIAYDDALDRLHLRTVPRGSVTLF